MLRQYFNSNERLEIFMTCFYNIVCYVVNFAASLLQYILLIEKDIALGKKDFVHSKKWFGCFQIRIRLSEQNFCSVDQIFSWFNQIFYQITYMVKSSKTFAWVNQIFCCPYNNYILQWTDKNFVDFTKPKIKVKNICWAAAGYLRSTSHFSFLEVICTEFMVTPGTVSQKLLNWLYLLEPPLSKSSIGQG